MRVLVACEYSGTVRDAFRAAGHYAMSCDLLPTEQPGPHYQGDVFDIIDDEWDALIGFPPCTYLANSGVRWLYNEDGSRNAERWENMREGARFFRALWHAPIRHICLENPIQHGYARQITRLRPTQVIQPWMFGHGETKATCLWLKGLPLLKPTDIVEGREPKVHRMPPGPDRWKERSRTYLGIANAMAEQWG